MKVSRIDFKAANAAEQFLNSIHESGFAVIYNHGVKVDLIQQSYTDWQKFFRSKEKLNFPFNKQKQIGYAPFRSENSIYQKELKNLSEFFNYYPWGIVPEQLKEQTFELHHMLEKIGETLLSWLDATLPTEVKQHFSMPLANMIRNSKTHLLRIIYYPAITGSETFGEIRTSRHEDSNLITLLACPTQPGLQIEDNQGNWHDVAYTNEDIVINIGAQLKLITQGYLPSTMHRVINPQTHSANNVARMSMPLFMHPRDEVMLDKKITAGQFLHDFLVKNGIK